MLAYGWFIWFHVSLICLIFEGIIYIYIYIKCTSLGDLTVTSNRDLIIDL